MKRLILIALSFAILMTFSFTIFAQSSTAVMYGDLNSDKKIDLIDLLFMKKHIVGYTDTINEQAADLNADGKIDLVDLLMMKKYIVGYDITLGKQVTITFNSNGGSAVSNAYVMSGTTIEELPAPTKTGSTFVAWMDAEGKTFDISTLITADITLTAKWN